MLQALVRRLFGKRTMPEIRRDVVRESAAPGYRPPRFSSTHELLVDELPVFNYFMMRLMLRDPVVQMGLSTRNAAMISGEVQVTASDPKITEFVQDQYRKIWTNYGHVIRRTKRWGFQGLEVILRRNPDTGLIEVGELRDFAPIDVVALTLPQHNHPVGMAIKNSAFYRDMVDQPTNRLTNVRLFAPNMIWLTYDGHWQNHWGHSIMRHSYASWYEKWMAGGAKKVQQLRMIKDAYIGELFKVPVGKTIQDPDNENRAFSWRQFAFEWAENRLAGGVGVIPNVFDDEGRSLVDYIPPSDTGNPTAIFEWGDRLDDEILKGMAVTPEVLQAAATGSGFSGRSIPLSMFLQSVGEEFKDYIAQIKLNLMDMLVFLNFGGEQVYDVEAVSLLETFSTEMGGSPMGGEAFGGQASSPFGQPPGGDTLGVQFGEAQKKKTKDVHVIGWDSLDEIVNVGVFATEQKRAELSDQVESEIAKHSTLNVGLLVAVGAVLNAFRTPLGEIVSQLMDASAKAGLLEVGRMAPESLAVGYASREQLAVQSTGPGVSAAHTVNPPAPVVLYRDTQPAAPTAPTSSEPSAIIGPSLRFPNLEKAVSDMGAKSVMQSGHYLEAASHVERGYFSITADLTDKQLMQIRDILQDHIDNGGTVDAFKREVVNLLGSSKAALSPNHLTTVYRAATMGALSDASHFHLSKMQLQFPYRRYASTRDDRVRKTHEAIETSGLNGTAIFRADDPFWLEIRPPWDYGCRCNWSPVSITQAAAAGVTEAIEWLARAKAMAKENGGHFGLYYAETAPDEPEHVKRPKVDGEPIKASKAWQRDGIQFSSLFDDDGEFRFKSDSPPKVTPAPPRAPAKPSSLFDIRSPGQPAKEFDESKHPRDSKGKFANKFGRTVGDEVTVQKGDHPLTVTGFDGERVEWKQKETGQTGVTHHKDFLEHNKYRLTRSNVDDLQAKVDKLNARAEKKGLDGRVWMKVSEEPHQTDHEIDSGDRLAWIANHRLRESHKKNLTGRIQQRFLVEVGGDPPSYKGWTFAAKLEPFAISVDGKEKTINLVQAANHDIDVDDRFTDMVGNCEHCNTKRKRRHTYVLNHEDGSQVCVGKSCLKDFLGHDNPNKFANYFDWLDSIHEDARQASGGEGADGYEGGPRGPVEYETDDALAWAAASVRKLGFKAKSYDEYNNTASHVSYLLNTPRRHTKAYEEWQEEREEFRPTEKDKEKVKLAREWIANEDVAGSSYLKKLQVVSSGIVQRESTLGVAASLIRAYDLAQGNDDKPDSDKPKALNEWFGKPRERVEVELEPVRFRGFTGAYGSGTVCTFRDNEGRTFVWFASGDKDEDDLPKGKYKATIKKHDEYSGTKQTIINRVKPA